MTTETKFKQTEIGLIPEDWDIKKIGQLADVRSSKRVYMKDYVKSGVPFYRSKEIIQKSNGQNISTELFISDDLYDKFKIKFGAPEEDDILITSVGTLGVSYRVKKEEKFYFKDGNLTWLRNYKNNIDPLYFEYFIKSNIFLEQLLANSIGSTQQAITIIALKKIKISLPKYEEQSAIAKILSDLDSKIELLQKQNETLEKIGQEIFKHWFVDFEFPNEQGKPYKSSGGKMVESELGEIPQGWSVGKLGDTIDKISKSVKEGEGLKGRKYVPIDKLPMKKLNFNDYLPYNEAKSSLISFEKNDILLGAMRVYFHRVNISPFAGVTRTTTFVLRPKKSNLLEFSLFLLYQDSTIDFANQNSRGSTMPYAVWKNSLENMLIIFPDDKTLSDFSKLLNPTIKRIRDSIFELRNLQKTRDLLLPKLMTGKIRVPLKASQ